MGFYLRKSIKVGPFRFNLSKSGVGVSAGVKGFPVGGGPRGNYVHMGRYGLYYRATLPSSSTPRRPIMPNEPHPSAPSGSHAPLQEIESADASQIVDSSSATLLSELNEKRKLMSLLPLAVVTTAVSFIIGATASWSPWILVSILAFGIVGSLYAHRRDIVVKTVVIFYEFDREMEEAYGQLHKWAEVLAACSKAWHIEAQGQVRDRKYHAGATSLVRRKPTFIRKTEPPFLKTNVETVAMGVGRQVLHFFPDRILVYDRGGVGAVSYSHLELSVDASRFIEDSGVPADAKVVDQTWKYVNKKGGPDRRFKDNRQLPICLYDEITIRSATGLNEVVQVSRCDVAQGFVEAILRLASRIPVEGPRPAV